MYLNFYITEVGEIIVNHPFYLSEIYLIKGANKQIVLVISENNIADPVRVKEIEYPSSRELDYQCELKDIEGARELIRSIIKLQETIYQLKSSQIQ